MGAGSISKWILDLKKIYEKIWRKFKKNLINQFILIIVWKIIIGLISVVYRNIF